MTKINKRWLTKLLISTRWMPNHTMFYHRRTLRNHIRIPAETVLPNEYLSHERLNLANRINATSQARGVHYLKDHKPNFQNNPTCRFINRSKSEIGKISKQILDRIDRKVIKSIGHNQWKKTEAVLKWSQNFPTK